MEDTAQYTMGGGGGVAEYDNVEDTMRAQYPSKNSTRLHGTITDKQGNNASDEHSTSTSQAPYEICNLHQRYIRILPVHMCKQLQNERSLPLPDTK